MSKQREALQVALDALIEVTGWQLVGPMRVMDEVEDAIAAIREALAEPEQEPVAWMCADEELSRKGYSRFSRNCEGEWNIPVYTTPPARKPLTDAIATARESYRGTKWGKAAECICDAIENKLRGAEWVK